MKTRIYEMSEAKDKYKKAQFMHHRKSSFNRYELKEIEINEVNKVVFPNLLFALKILTL